MNFHIKASKLSFHYCIHADAQPLTRRLICFAHNTMFSIWEENKRKEREGNEETSKRKGKKKREKSFHDPEQEKKDVTLK